MTSLLDDYRRHAADHGAYMIEGEADASNESYDRLQEVFVALARDGLRNDLFRLYDDSDPGCNVGQQGIRWKSMRRGHWRTRSLRKQEFLKRQHGRKYTIQEWKSGGAEVFAVVSETPEILNAGA